VNPAWLAAKDQAGASAVKATASGSSAHATAMCDPTARVTPVATTIPATVPASALSADRPVLSAVARSTASVPNDTQNACSMRSTLASKTETPSATHPRTAVWNHTESGPRCARARAQMRLGGIVVPLAAPVT
jgi:hypothetical protein